MLSKPRKIIITLQELRKVLTKQELKLRKNHHWTVWNLICYRAFLSEVHKAFSLTVPDTI